MSDRVESFAQGVDDGWRQRLQVMADSHIVDGTPLNALGQFEATYGDLRAALRYPPASPTQGVDGLPSISAMTTALTWMRLASERSSAIASKVSGEGEAAEIYGDAAKCIAFALAASRSPAECRAQVTLEDVADAIDEARYRHPDHPRERPRPFSEADRGDREYAFRLARAALRASPGPNPDLEDDNMRLHREKCDMYERAIRAEALVESVALSDVEQASLRGAKVIADSLLESSTYKGIQGHQAILDLIKIINRLTAAEASNG